MISRENEQLQTAGSLWSDPSSIVQSPTHLPYYSIPNKSMSRQRARRQGQAKHSLPLERDKEEGEKKKTNTWGTEGEQREGASRERGRANK